MWNAATKAMNAKQEARHEADEKIADVLGRTGRDKFNAILYGVQNDTDAGASASLDFPLFPVPPAGAVLFNEDSGRVDMSLDFFERIYEYKVRVEEAQAAYEKTKALYEGKGERE